MDASIVLGWLLAQEQARAATEVLEAHIEGRDRVVAPELLHYEVGNALVRGVRLTANAARDGYDRFLALDIMTYALGPAEYASAITLAATYGVTVYDASYVALAQALASLMVTADRKLARAVRKLGLVEVV